MLNRLTLTAFLTTLLLSTGTTELLADLICNHTPWTHESDCDGVHYVTTICSSSFTFTDCTSGHPPLVVIHDGWAVIEGDGHERVVIEATTSGASGASGHDPAIVGGAAATTAPGGGDPERGNVDSRILMVVVRQGFDVVYSVKPKGSRSLGTELTIKEKPYNPRPTDHGKPLGAKDGEFWTPSQNPTLPNLEYKVDPTEIDKFIEDLRKEDKSKK